MAETKAGIQCQCKSYRCCWRPGFLPSFQLQILSADLRLREAMGIKQLGKFLKSSCASAMSHHSCASEYKAPELAEMINPWVVKVGFFMLVFAGTGILRIPGLPPCETHPNIELVLFQWASATQDESKVGGFKYFLNIFQLVSLGGSQSKISRYKTGHWVTNDCRMICFFFLLLWLIMLHWDQIHPAKSNQEAVVAIDVSPCLYQCMTAPWTGEGQEIVWTAGECIEN